MGQYVGTVWVNDDTPVDASNMNKIELMGENSLQKGGTADAGETTIVFAEFANTSTAGAVTIDLSVSQKQKLTLTEDVTITFASPGGAANCILRVIQDATGGWAVTIAGTPDMAGREAYVASTDPASKDILTVYFDGTDYNIAPSYDFGPAV